METKYLCTSTRILKLKKKQWFVKFLLFLHFIVTGKFELLEILGTFKMAEHSYPSSLHSKPICFCRFNIVRTSRSQASIYVQSLLKFPTWDAQGRSKSPPHPVSPSLGHNIDSCITTVTETPKGWGYLTHVWVRYRGAPEVWNPDLAKDKNTLKTLPCVGQQPPFQDPV